MKWTTEWKRELSPWKIDPGMQVLALGSCFAEHVVMRLRQAKCTCALNPSGILYNPVSIARSLDSWITGEPLTERFVSDQGVFHSLDHHSALSAMTEVELRERIERTDEEAARLVRDSDVAVISFGTAWVYEWNNDNGIVANCHKQPASTFTKRMLSTHEIVSVWGSVLRNWKERNPKLRIILTVSPVRHLKDGFIENQRSKASLILAVSELVSKHNDVAYFPAYELMIDELRDYRFYGEDLVHPNNLAVDHIMDAFGTCYFSEKTRGLADRVRAWQRGVEHRPFFPASPAYLNHLDNLANQLSRFRDEAAHLDWSEEQRLLNDRYDQISRST